MNLKAARFFKGFNQWDIAVRTGISQSSLSLIERGYKVPSDDEKKKLSRVLGRKVEEIFPDNNMK